MRGPGRRACAARDIMFSHPLRSAFAAAILLAVRAPAGAELPVPCDDLVLDNVLGVVVLNEVVAEPLVNTDPACVGGDEAQLLLGDAVVARWTHDDASVTDAIVVLDGPGVDPTPRPMTAFTYTDVDDGSARRRTTARLGSGSPPASKGP